MDWKNKKTKKLPSWPAPGSPWPTFEMPTTVEPEPKWCNSVTEAIFRELYRRYKIWRKPPFDIDAVLAKTLAEEIRNEIDAEILKTITEGMKVPGNKI